MLVDIHTHRLSKLKNNSIYNLKWEELPHTLQSEKEGYFSLGFHPWQLNDFSETKLELLSSLLSDKRVLALGECGLDKNSNYPLHEQEVIFEKQILLAEEKQKALIIHCVGCFNEVLAMKKRLRPSQKWIIHGFRGKAQLAEQLLRAGCSLSFGEKFNETSLRITPLEQLFVETDESPLPIETIYARLAEARGCKSSEMNAGAQWLNSL